MARKFVKDYQNIEDVKVRTSYGLFSSIVGIRCDMLLFTVRLLAGLLVSSISVMADALNNLSDATSSIIGFVGVKVTGKSTDEDHPFGYGRIKYTAASIVAFTITQMKFSLFKTSFGKIRNPEVMTFNMVSMVTLLLSIGVRLWMSVFNRILGKRIQSKVMLTTTVDSMGDVVTTSATIPSIVVFGIWGVNIDGFIGLMVSVVVMIAGVNITKDTLAPLIGEVIDPKVYKEITDFVEQYDEIVGSHDLIVYNYGPFRSIASIYAEVPSGADMEVSHEIVDTVRWECARKLGIFLVIHMGPVEVTNTRVSGFRNMVADVLVTLDSRLQFHDFRAVDGMERVNLIFDLMVPRDYNSQPRDTIKLKVSKRVHERDFRCYCVITMENSFYAEIPEGVQE